MRNFVRNIFIKIVEDLFTEYALLYIDNPIDASNALVVKEGFIQWLRNRPVRCDAGREG